MHLEEAVSEDTPSHCTLAYVECNGAAAEWMRPCCWDENAALVTRPARSYPAEVLWHCDTAQLRPIFGNHWMLPDHSLRT